MAKKTTGKTAAWIGLAGAAVAGLYFWAKKAEGQRLNAHYSVLHQGPAATLKKSVRLGSWDPLVGFNEVGSLVVTNVSLPLEYHPTPTLVEGDIELRIPTDTTPGLYDAEFSIRKADNTDIFPDGMGKTRDIKENAVEIEMGGGIIIP